MIDENLINKLISQFRLNNILSNQDYKKTIIEEYLPLLSKKAEAYTDLNAEKILTIMLILLNKIEEMRFESNPPVITLTATVLWHNAINRPGDDDYMQQDEIEKRFDASINAERYLRKELGINKRTYSDLEDLIEDLNKNEPPDYGDLKVSSNTPEWEDLRQYVIKNIFQRSNYNQNALEATIFLFLNAKKSYTKSEIWDATKYDITLEGDTPEASFNSDLSRYTINSDTKRKRTPQLFEIIDINEQPHKIKLLKEIKQELNKFLDMKEFWICPKDSCYHKKIQINRNENIIDTSSWINLIIHILEHLNQNLKYFGPSTFEDFLEDDLNHLLSKEDKQIIEYERSDNVDKATAKDITWKNRMRSALAQIKIEGYIETDKDSEDESFKAHYRSRRRTDKFFNKYKLYDDWSDLETPFVWQMVKEASNYLAENNGEPFSYSDIRDYIKNKYGNINEKTINSQIIACTVNHYSRVNYPNNQKARISNSKYDFLYRIEEGKGELELYNPEKHGIWEIKEDNSGNFIIVLQNIEPDYSNFINSSINIENIKLALFRKKQIVLMGPPGTSKTYLAEQIAFDIIEDPTHYELVQFHPSYSYEDFVEGIETESTRETPLKFIPKKKIFRKICEKAKILQENQKYFVLIIDEINRGNVEKIFGELILGLEKRDKPIQTLYINEKLVIPENLLIIGTMNTVDLSITNIDAALRRRFFIIPIMPDKTILKNWLKSKYKENYIDFQKALIDLMDKFNKKVRLDNIYLGPYRQLGHTYFFIEPEDTIEKLIEKMDINWKYSIKPLLLEYFNFSEELLNEYKEIYNDFKNNFKVE